MAFNTANAAPASTASNDSWKAQGFLNFYLLDKQGKERKVGAIGLKESKANEKQLMEWLESDPANIDKFSEKLICKYQSAVPVEGNAFDLG